MFEFEYVNGIATMPTGEKISFPNEDEAKKAYEKEENMIYDDMAEIYSEVIDYPEDW
ncbi:MAG: hypothetical protein J6W49_04920 [Paludibacteraceae bacterium]|nr:hypothetical protein [Paludibacteraceae bacterium]